MGRAWAAWVFALSSAGCATLGTVRSQVDGAGDVFPLRPGSAWTYQVRDVSGRTAAFKMRVRGDVDVDAAGTRATLVEETGGMPGARALDRESDLVAYYSREGIVFRLPWRWGAAGGVDVARSLAEAEPVVSRDPRRQTRWEGHYDVLAIDGPPLYEVASESRVAASDERVTVPAGTFSHCVRVETRIAARTPSRVEPTEIVHYFEEWYAPGVGLVRQRSAVDVGGKRRDVLSVELAAFDRGASD